jgi:hypothetical protein
MSRTYNMFIQKIQTERSLKQKGREIGPVFTQLNSMVIYVRPYPGRQAKGIHLTYTGELSSILSNDGAFKP